MKRHLLSLLPAGLLTTLLVADPGGPRPDGHAPIGVMGDHTHHAGESMFSYRFMTMEMDGLRSGTSSLSTREVLARGFSMAPTEMDMQMHMIGYMFAPSDSLTLMAMANYVSKDMRMTTSGHGMTMMHGDMHGHHGGTHRHSTSGIGDVTLSALMPLRNGDTTTLHAGLGLGLPTAEVEEMQNGQFQPYGMQPGNGVWDLRPSLTLNSRRATGSCGAQVSGRINLESENDAGFAFGDQAQITAWYAHRIGDSVSLSGRVIYDYQADIQGHYNGPHGHGSPPQLKENYGGDVLQAAAGVNVICPDGHLKGHRFALELFVPVHEDLNGIQMSRDYSIMAGWQKAW